MLLRRVRLVTAPREPRVYHLCTREALEAARAAGAYRADSLGREGFIHCSQAHQVLPTAHNYFRGLPNIVVLVIDPARLTSRLVYEPPASLPTVDDAPLVHTGDLYPHCYGPIDIDAIVDVVELGAFVP
jgi:uncharacterized protein (DUF952 family)